MITVEIIGISVGKYVSILKLSTALLDMLTLNSTKYVGTPAPQYSRLKLKCVQCRDPIVIKNHQFTNN